MFIENPLVEVTEITFDVILNRIVDLNGVPVRVDLGDDAANRNINSVLNAIRQQRSKSFLLRWVGSRVPRGAVVGAHVIGWTQHGVVSNGEGKMIGVYDRLVDTGQDQVMLVQIFLKQK